MNEARSGGDALFILLGAIMVLAMHGGFAFLELGTVRAKNQVNALVKIMVDFAVSTVAYFFVGYAVAYGIHFFTGADALAAKNGYELVKFFFLLTFAAAIPAIVSGGIAERSRFGPQLDRDGRARRRWSIRSSKASPGTATSASRPGSSRVTGAEFHDFAGSVVVHAVGGWVGARRRAPARRAQQPLPQGRRGERPSAVEHPLPRPRRLDAHRRLVRLQRDERADARQDLRPGRRQLADGDGRRNDRRDARRPQRPRLRPQRPARRPRRRLRRLRRHASARRARHRRRRRRDLRASCSP